MKWQQKLSKLLLLLQKPTIMKITSILASAFLCSLIISCKENKPKTTAAPAETEIKAYSQLEKTSWFLGSWGHTSKEGTLAENWVKVNDSVYKGESYFIIGKDTVFAEAVDLAEANGKLTYTVSVKGPANEAPVPFEMTSVSDKAVVFENPKHDFPNKITYNRVTDDSLVAVISGIQKGKPAMQTFAMKKLK